MSGTRIAVITDVHANLPALAAVLGSIRTEGCNAVFHTGDAIAIGPYPSECLELLLNTPTIRLLMGNHDAYFADGLPEPRPAWMSKGEVEHQRWTHARLGSQLRSVIARWPYSLELEFEGVRTTFVHYGLAPSGRDFAPVAQNPTATDLDHMFEQHQSHLVFYGHHHPFSDTQGRARYVSPGSLGCHSAAVARYCLAEFHTGQYTIEHRGVVYDDSELLKAFEQRKVPERQFIDQAFFGGRLRG